MILYTQEELFAHIGKPIKCTLSHHNWYTRDLSNYIIEDAILGYSSDRHLFGICQNIVSGGIVDDFYGYARSWRFYVREDGTYSDGIYNIKLL